MDYFTDNAILAIDLAFLKDSQVQEDFVQKVSIVVAERIYNMHNNIK